MVLIVINIDGYYFLAFSDFACDLKDPAICVSWLDCATW